MRYYRSTILACMVTVLLSLWLDVRAVASDADILREAEMNIRNKHYAAARAIVVPAAKAGDPYAEYLLGGMYLNGVGVTQDIDTAIALLQQSASQGYPTAESDLGAMYATGRNVDKDVAHGLELLRKAVAAEDASAYYNLAVLYRDGNGVERDMEMARVNFSKAADKGYALAQYAMGRYYFDSQEFAKAITWYTKAADQGDLDAMYNVGYMYHMGLGVERSDDTANRFFMKNAALGAYELDGSHQYKALDMLGNSYRDGLGVRVDKIEAVKWYYLAAVRGHPDAMGQLRDLASTMTPEDVNAAKQRAQEWASHPSSADQ